MGQSLGFTSCSFAEHRQIFFEKQVLCVSLLLDMLGDLALKSAVKKLHKQNGDAETKLL